MKPRCVVIGILLLSLSALPSAGQESGPPQSAAVNTWTRAASHAPWQTRCYHSTVVFKNKIWILGGYHESVTQRYSLNDIWCSEDGVSWTLVTDNAPWSIRYGMGVGVLDDRLWLIGGSSDDGLNDVWYSDDGATWTQATAQAQWSPRHWFASAVFDNKLWVLGGIGPTSQNDVWYSSDGVDWIQATDHAPWLSRDSPASVVFNGRLWIMGGAHYYWDMDWLQDLSDIWSTTDGVNWQETVPNAAWGDRYASTATAFESGLWLLAGVSVEGSGLESVLYWQDDVWRSAEGTIWVRETAQAPWMARIGHTATEFNGKLWLLGGLSDAPYGSSNYGSLNDVWYLSGAPTGRIETAQRGWIEESQSLSLTALTTNLVGSVSYQWTKDSVPISGAAYETYHVDALNVEDSGWYGCQVTDESKAVLDLAPVLIQVFPEGSLPVGGIAGVAALAILTASCFVLFSRKRHAKHFQP